MKAAISSPYEVVRETVPDGLEPVRDVVVRLCDELQVDLVLTTGGTGPSPRDLTVEAMQAVSSKELPGFGELMRRVSLQQVPTAILSRQSAYVRGATLIINLPGSPGAITVCLQAVFPAVPYCLDLIGGGRMEVDPLVVAAYRPKG